MVKRRLLAYLIDILIVSIIFVGIILILPKNNNINVLESELTVLNEQFLKEDLETSVYINRYANITHAMDKENVLQVILNTLCILIYFVLLPYYWDGRTIGMKLCKIRIVKEKEKLSIGDLTTRALIINGIACTLLSLCFIYLVGDIPYFVLSTILGFVQFLLVIFSGFMVIYRHDKKGVHDLISHTQVVLEGKV